jgi:hypothetical protein
VHLEQLPGGTISSKIWLIFITSNVFQGIISPTMPNHDVFVRWKHQNIEGVNGKYVKICATTMKFEWEGKKSITFSNYRLGFWVYVDLLNLDWNFVFTWKYEKTFLWDRAICFSIRVYTNSHTLQQIVDNDHTRVEIDLKHNNEIS